MVSKRKTRSQRQGQKFNVGGAWTEEEKTHVQPPNNTAKSHNDMRSGIPFRDNALSHKSTEKKPLSKSDIDQIRSEIFEEKYISSVEPEYWDDSHNWDLDGDTESEEYWHFVGRYE